MLNVLTLTREILRLTDKTREDFVGWPTSSQETAEHWADCAVTYTQEMNAPIVLPPTLLLAREAFIAAMLVNLTVNALGALAQGWSAFTQVIAATPVPPQVLTPPPAPFVAAPGIPTADPTPPALQLATTIDAWIRTGTVIIGPSASPWL